MKHFIIIELVLVRTIVFFQINIEREINSLVELFANFKPETPFHPKWGIERATQILEYCRS